MLFDITPPITSSLAVWPGDTPPSREVLLDMHKGDNETCAIKEAAGKTGVSTATVRRAWRKFKAFTKSPTL